MFRRFQNQSHTTPLKLLGAVCVALLAFGCSTPTPYGPALDGKGYSQRQTESDRYRVSFSGNTLTPRETVESYLLYRASEITLGAGHSHFRVVQQDLETTTTYYDTVTAPPAFGYYGTSSRYWRRHRHHGHRFHSFPYATYPYGQFSTVTSRPVTSYQAVANIIVFSLDDGDDGRDGEIRDADHVYDARDVIKQLGPMIVRPEDETD